MAIDSIEQYRVGLPEIDDDHSGLITMINRIGADLGEASYALCVELFDELQDAASAHFNREEQLLEQLGYPEIDGHREYHAELLRRVRELKALGYEKVGKEALLAQFTQMADFLVDD